MSCKIQNNAFFIAVKKVIEQLYGHRFAEAVKALLATASACVANEVAELQICRIFLEIDTTVPVSKKVIL